MSARTIHWAEWDFSDVPKREWSICLNYELSRESEATKARVAAARSKWPDICFEEQFDFGFFLPEERCHLPECAYWPEFPKPFQKIKASIRAPRVKMLNVKPLPIVRELMEQRNYDPFPDEIMPEFWPHSTENYTYIALEIYRNATRSAFLEACGELWNQCHNPDIPVASGQGRTSDIERLKWLGAWRLLKHTRGDTQKAQRICDVRGKDPLYLSEKGWRKARAAAAELLKCEASPSGRGNYKFRGYCSRAYLP